MENFDELYLQQRAKDFTPERNQQEATFIEALLLSDYKQHTLVDFCCGHGRHANILASRGYRIVGYDASQYFIDVAKETVSKAEFIRRDLFQGPAPQKFDFGYCFFSSFGFYNDEDNLIMLDNMLSSVDRRFLLNVMNREWLIQNLLPVVNETVGDRKYVLYPSLDLTRSVYIKKQEIYKNGELETSRVSEFRLYCLHEYIEMFRRCGWKLVATYGSNALPSVSYDENSRWLTIVVERL